MPSIGRGRAGFVNRNRGRLTARDGNLDVVAWKPFADRRPGKLILFGQCKTGTHYRDTLAQLQPDAFCTKWVRDPLALAPVRAFFITEALPWSLWRNAVADAGLLFDRCRIIDFADGVNRAVLASLTAWTTAAAQASGLPGGGPLTDLTASNRNGLCPVCLFACRRLNQPGGAASCGVRCSV